jgi:hypothetical protein
LCENGREAAHEFSALDPARYTHEGTDRKLDHLDANYPDRPFTCATVEGLRPGGCDGCKYRESWVKKGKELKRDIETALIQNKAATSGGATSARVAASVETWIFAANHVKMTTQTTASTTIPASGLAVTTGVDGTAVAFTEADLKTCLQQAWSCGGETDVILLGASLKNKLDAFSGIATRFRNVAAGAQADIVAAADVFVSSYGSHKVVLSRYMRASVVLCLDMNTWGIAWLDPIQSVSMPKTGDSEKHMIVCEYTLVAKSPTANTKLTNAI